MWSVTCDGSILLCFYMPNQMGLEILVQCSSSIGAWAESPSYRSCLFVSVIFWNPHPFRVAYIWSELVMLVISIHYFHLLLSSLYLIESNFLMSKATLKIELKWDSLLHQAAIFKCLKLFSSKFQKTTFHHPPAPGCTKKTSPVGWFHVFHRAKSLAPLGSMQILSDYILNPSFMSFTEISIWIFSSKDNFSGPIFGCHLQSCQYCQNGTSDHGTSSFSIHSTGTVPSGSLQSLEIQCQKFLP